MRIKASDGSGVHSLYALMESHDLILDVYITSCSRRFIVRIEEFDVKGPEFPLYTRGTGDTLSEAVDDYIVKINRKTIIHRMAKREIEVGNLI